MIVTSVCSRREWTQRTVLYGSTTAVATWGQAQTVKLSFDFFPVVHGQALKHETAEAGTRAATARMKDHEALQTSAVVSELPDAIEDEVDNLLPNRVMAAGKIVGCILFSRDELLWVEELPVSA